MSINFDGTARADYDMGDPTAARFLVGSSWTSLSFIRIEDTASDESSLVTKWSSSGAQQQIMIRVAMGTAPQPIIVDHNSTRVLTGSSIIELNTWYLVAVSNDGAGGLTLNVLEMDGTLVEDAATASLGTDTATLTSSIRFGCRNGPNDPTTGDLAYIAYLKREIGQSEILEYLRNPAKVVHRVGGATGCEYIFPMTAVANTHDWSGNGHVAVESLSHTEGDNPPIASLYGGFHGWQGDFVEGAAPSVFLRDLMMAPGIIPFTR